MAKSQILKDLANNNDISLEVALKRLIVIASNIDNNELKKWAENELGGYGVNENVPPYRVVRVGQIICNSIIGGMPAPLPKYLNDFPNNVVEDILSRAKIKHGVNIIIKEIDNSKQESRIDLFECKNLICDTMNIQCTQLYIPIDKSQLEEVRTAIEIRLLNIFLELDKTLGNLDNLDITIDNMDKLPALKTNIVNIIYDNSVKMGDGNRIDKSELVGGLHNGG